MRPNAPQQDGALDQLLAEIRIFRTSFRRGGRWRFERLLVIV
jgi:hypothetical protein